MAKQPYIPLYTGDYLKDTRILPLSVRGAWVDLMIFMWESKDRGVLIYTMEEYARMISCSLDDANFAFNLLFEKGICDHEFLPNGMIKLISRRMVRDANISKKRSEAGKNGGRLKNVKQNHKQTESKTISKLKANNKANIKQIPDIEYDNDNEYAIGIDIKSNGVKKNINPGKRFEPNCYATAEEAFEEIKNDEQQVERLLMTVRRSGFNACDEIVLMKAVRHFLTVEFAKPDFTNRPRDDLKKHLVNWVRLKAKVLNQFQ